MRWTRAFWRMSNRFIQDISYKSSSITPYRFYPLLSLFHLLSDKNCFSRMWNCKWAKLLRILLWFLFVYEENDGRTVMFWPLFYVIRVL